jgi:hypothetical protein
LNIGGIALPGIDEAEKISIAQITTGSQYLIKKIPTGELLVGAGITSFFCFGAGVRFAYFRGMRAGLFMLAVISSIKTRALKDKPGAAADQPFHFLLTLGAFI